MNNAERIIKLRAAVRGVITFGSPLREHLLSVLRETKVQKRSARN